MIVTVNEEAPFHDEEVWRSVRDVAESICKTANRNTTAPIGVTFRDMDSGLNRRVHIGPRGAAAIPVEFGHQGVPAKRPVKRALDEHRI